MNTVAILASLVVLASAKNTKSSGPDVQIKSLGASRVGGVEINDIIVEDIASIFEFNDFDAADALFVNRTETVYRVRQARLNNRPFTVTIDVRSQDPSPSTDAVFKFFLGPRYFENGYPISIESNWDLFVEIDSFIYALTPGQNTIVRIPEINSSLSPNLTNILQNAGVNFVVSLSNLI